MLEIGQKGGQLIFVRRTKKAFCIFVPAKLIFVRDKKKLKKTP